LGPKRDAARAGREARAELPRRGFPQEDAPGRRGHLSARSAALTYPKRYRARSRSVMGPSGFEPESSGPEPPRIDQATPRTRDGRVRATGEHRRAGDETRGAGGHPPSPDRTRPRGTDLKAGADFMKSGIVSYGGYIPRYRIRPKDIGTVWGADGEAMGRGLNIRAKSVPGPDEDVITISVEAARACMAKVDIDPTEIGAIYVGSESHPYAVKPTATIVAEA